VTIRMNRHMHAVALAQTDVLVGVLDPDGSLGLLGVLTQTRDGNGALPWREHDFQALLERLARQSGQFGSPAGNGVTAPALRQALGVMA